MAGVVLGIRIPPNVYDEFMRVVDLNDKTKSEVIIWLMKQYIARFDVKIDD